MTAGSRTRRLDRLQRAQRRQLLMVAVVVATEQVSLFGPDPQSDGGQGVTDDAPARGRKKREFPALEACVRQRFADWQKEESHLFARLDETILTLRNKRYLKGPEAGPLALEDPVIETIIECLPPDTALSRLTPVQIDHVNVKLGYAPSYRRQVQVVEDQQFKELGPAERERAIAAATDSAVMTALQSLSNILMDEDSNEFARTMAGGQVLTFKGRMALVNRQGKPINGIDDLDESECDQLLGVIAHVRQLKSAQTVDADFTEVTDEPRA